MKKFIAFLTGLIYLAVSSGLAVEIHHCMGEVADVSFISSHSSDSKTCSNCDMPKGSNECCKDELKFVKLNDSHKLLDANHNLFVPVAVLNHRYTHLSDEAVQRTLRSQINGHSPPGSSYSLHILNCVFRI